MDDIRIGIVPKKCIISFMRRIALVLLILTLSACTARRPDPAVAIQVAVMSTLTALPVSTAAPPSTPYPTPTRLDLAGLFCEYQFCIGHPADMALFDVNAQSGATSSSNYSQGLLAAFSENLFIQVMWQLASGSADPQFMLDLILDDVDTRTGTLDVKLIRDMNVVFTPITTTATAVLPFGGAGAWVCGERAFAWKVYSSQAENAQVLFESALDRFQCNR
jgi:hypothetical protein